MNKLNDFLLGFPCHRKKERCFHIKGEQMMLCSRCTAIYVSYIFLPLFFFIPTNIYLFLCSPLFIVPLVVDGYTQKWGWRTSNQFLRVLTGFLFTAGQCLFITQLLKNFFM